MSKTRLSLALLLIVLIGAGAWIRQHSQLREGRDLKPRPDALEYGLTSARLANGGDYTLDVDGVTYPPRYPPGFPIMAAPVLRATGGDAFDCWQASFLYGLLSILLTALLAHLIAGPIAALAAGAVMACTPAHVLSSGLAMSETAMSTLVVGAMLCIALALRGRSARPRIVALVAAGLAIGGAFSIRYTGLAFLLPALLLLATRHRLAPTRKAMPSLAVLTPTLAVVGAVLIYNARTFGGVLRDGYHFWVPALYGTPLCFDLSYAMTPGPAARWTEGNLRVYAEVLLGLRGNLFTPALAVAAAIGALWIVGRARTCPIARLAALSAFVALPAMFVFHLVYYWQDPRFLLPLLPVLAVLVGAGARSLADLLGQAARPRDATIAVAIASVALAVHLGWPVLTADRAEVPPMVDRLEALDADLERDALVIVNFPRSIATALLGRDRRVLVDAPSTPGGAEAADPHLAAIAAYALPGLDTRQPGASYLAANGHPLQDRMHEIDSRVRGGRPVYVVFADHEAAEGAGIRALRAQYTFEELFFRKPVTVYQIRPR